MESSFIPVTKPRLTDFHCGVSALYICIEHVIPLENLEIPHLEITSVGALLSGIKSLIASVYIPPNKDIYLLSLDRLLQNICPQPNLILLGDFNCMDLVWEKWHPSTAHYFSGKAWSMGMKLLDICKTHGLTISNNATYTREEDDDRSSPDLSLIRGVNYTWRVDHYTCLNNDHLPIMIQLPIVDKAAEQKWDLRNMGWNDWVKSTNQTFNDFSSLTEALTYTKIGEFLQKKDHALC